MKIVFLVFFLCITSHSSYSFDFYTKTSKIYFDVLPKISSMRGLYNTAPNGGIAYIMSEHSGKDFCWLKDIDSNGVINIRKFYVDWTDEKYIPETYGRFWNDMCKSSKRKKKFVNTDKIINDTISFIESYYSSKNDVIHIVHNSPFTNTYSFYYIQSTIGGHKTYTAKVNVLELFTTDYGIKQDSIPFIVYGPGEPLYISYQKNDICVNLPGTEDNTFRRLIGIFLRRLKDDGFFIISCDD